MPWSKLLIHEKTKKLDDAILVYIHQSDKYGDPRRQERTILLDVQSQGDAVRISTLFNDTRERSASMFVLEYTPVNRDYFRRYTHFRSAAWYLLPLDFLRRANYRAVEEGESGELYLRAHLSIGYLEDASKFRTPSPSFATNKLPPNYFEYLLSPSTNPQADAALLTIVDCGHANWNEIRTGGRLYLYDAGACRSYNAHQVRRLVARRKIASESGITIIISHWDIDHFHALLAFDLDDIKNIDWLVVPSNTPGTATYSRVAKMLQEQNVKILSLPHASRDILHDYKRSIELFPVASLGNIYVLRATAGASSNQTGIVLVVAGAHQVALLTGDHHYDKVLRGYHRLSFRFDRCLMVAPHHGGHAGSLDRLPYPFYEILIPLSCGINQWGHPYGETLSRIRGLQQGPPLRTDEKGDLKFFI